MHPHGRVRKGKQAPVPALRPEQHAWAGHSGGDNLHQSAVVVGFIAVYVAGHRKRTTTACKQRYQTAERGRVLLPALIRKGVQGRAGRKHQVRRLRLCDNAFEPAPLPGAEDGVPIVIHDETVDRTTDGHGKVSELTFAELRSLDAGVRKDARFTGTRVPTFEETLAMMPRNVWLNCHLKGGAALGAATAKVIASAARKHQAFLAATADAAQGAREVVPDILVCNMERQGNSWDYVTGTIAMKAQFIQLRGKGEVDAEQIRALKANGVRVSYFQVNTPEGVRQLFEKGVDFPLVNDLAMALPIAREIGIAPLARER